MCVGPQPWSQTFANSSVILSADSGSEKYAQLETPGASVKEELVKDWTEAEERAVVRK